MENLPQDKKIILFDGICNLCNTSVQYIIKNDQKDIFRFVSLQSELGQKITKHLCISDRNIDSIVLYEPGRAYFLKSDAALKIAKDLGGFLSWLAVFSFLPKFFRDYIYDYIATNRYKWYGKKESCMIPTPELKAKFL